MGRKDSFGLKSGRKYGNMHGLANSNDHAMKRAMEKSLNYIEQLGLKDNLRLKRGFSIKTLCPHENDIPLVRGGHLEGPNVFGFLICPLVSEL